PSAQIVQLVSYLSMSTLRHCTVRIKIIPVVSDMAPAGIERSSPASQIIPVSIRRILIPSVVQHTAPTAEIIQVSIDHTQLVSLHGTVFIKIIPVDSIFDPARCKLSAGRISPHSVVSDPGWPNDPSFSVKLNRIPIDLRGQTVGSAAPAAQPVNHSAVRIAKPAVRL